jgi:hypothetical protein
MIQSSVTVFPSVSYTTVPVLVPSYDGISWVVVHNPALLTSWQVSLPTPQSLQM